MSATTLERFKALRNAKYHTHPLPDPVLVIEKDRHFICIIPKGGLKEQYEVRLFDVLSGWELEEEYTDLLEECLEYISSRF